MPINLPGRFRGRGLLLAGAASTAALILPKTRAFAANTAGQLPLILRPAPGRANILGPGQPSTDVLAYNSQISGPVLRLTQDQEFRAEIVNGLDQGTTVHWHGLRIPVAMDGVPGISQPPIPPGEKFNATYTPPDAGTFWYHPHLHTAHQMGRGLAGALIVDEAQKQPFDRELLWVLQDWQFEADGQFVPGFDTPMEAGMGGRIGDVVTINGVVPSPVAVRAGERIRLRLINACLARFMSLAFTGHDVRVLALDGQPVLTPFAPRDGRVLIGPAQRVDLLLEASGEPGQRYPVTDDFYGGSMDYQLVNLAYTAQARIPGRTASWQVTLPPNPVPKPDLSNPVRHRLTIVGGMMGSGLGNGTGGGMMGGMGMMMGDNAANQPPIWGIRDKAGLNSGMTPMFTIPLGKTVVITLDNQTAFWHPMHLHGYSFTVLSHNNVPEPQPILRDTVILQPQDQVEIAFAADNPGDWMFHCHVIQHQESGLMTVIRVA